MSKLKQSGATMKIVASVWEKTQYLRQKIDPTTKPAIDGGDKDIWQNSQEGE
ncbi:hypothetical protein [Algirhabdus cladophorae]|uniref:hypothetical protein n=1 Tax=Algirhabdus cladophorae TaxID=3377108 RepID=UPI003B847B23